MIALNRVAESTNKVNYLPKIIVGFESGVHRKL
jgi:hypothetical protein